MTFLNLLRRYIPIIMHKHVNNRDDDGYYVLLGLICAVLITTAAILFSIGIKMLA